MKEKAILLIHGMGVNTPPTGNKSGSFGEEFAEATTATLQQFAKHKKDTLADHADLQEFNFDGWFDQMRTTMADNARSMESRLKAVGKIYGASIPLNLASTLTGLEAKFGDEKFFYTHWLDVIFYGTMLGAKVRVDAGVKIAGLVEQYGGANVHIMAHSLGTAVLHDTLHLLYRPEADPNDEIPDLHPVNHQLGSVWMFANVSRLVNSVTRLSDPLGSLVKPGDGGCTAAFFNVRHKLDPFTWLARFDPQNNGAWVSNYTYSSAYASIVTDLVFEANTHSFPQYLQDPKVVEIILPFLLYTDFQTNFVEMKAVADARSKKSLNGAYAALEDALKDALKTPDNISGWQVFLDTAVKFKAAEKLIEDNF